jgi:serine/threonine protein kinase
MFDYIVAQKRVPEPQACRFFHQLIDGIEVLHRNEVTHRDLKPEVRNSGACPIFISV